MIKIESLSETNFCSEALDLYNRKQDVNKVYRKTGGEYTLVECKYTEDWDLNKKRSVAKQISSDDYITYIALDNDKVVGFIGLLRKLNGPYMILDMMQVSSEYRGQGVGRRLFEAGKAEARKAGAEALYISACSSEETIAFYRAMGSCLANDPIKEIAEEEPYDLQMICPVKDSDLSQEGFCKKIVIKPLTAELNEHYLDFFDNRAFTDNNPNGTCYCISPNQDEETVRQMVGEFKKYGVKETLRRYAVEMLNKGQIHGYLAYDGGLSVGWCNAADIESYAGFVPDTARENICGKTISIVCFEIAPKYRGMGIASAFIERVCLDAKAKGYSAVEGYPKIYDKRNDFDYQGPVRLYQKAGFTEVLRKDGQAIMRKVL